MSLPKVTDRNSAVIVLAGALVVLWLTCARSYAQEPKSKIRIANSAMSVTSLPLVAARDWKLFREQNLDVEIILMSPAITVPAMISGEIDYVAGVGPGVVSASLSGLSRRLGVLRARVVFARRESQVQEPSGS
jgi:ABC-type nitrate/sulfonate/bicarbonate transport system substrate-binding protein